MNRLRLPLMFAVIVVAYHTINFAKGSFYPFRWNWEPFQIVVNAKPLVTLRTFIEGNNQNRPTDAASDLVAHWARWMNAWESDEGGRRELPIGAQFSRVARPTIPAHLVREFPDFVNRIQGCGAELQVIAVPQKFIVEAMPFTTHELVSVYQTLVNIDREHIIDLYTPLRERYLSHTSAPLFVTDGHWSSLGIAVSGEKIVEHLVGRGMLSSKARAKFVETVAEEHRDDQRETAFAHKELSRHLKLHSFYTLESEGEQKTGLKRVVLFGTSFSNQFRARGFNLGVLLGKVTGLPVIDKSFDSAGLIGSIKTVGEDGFVVLPGDLILWEFPMGALADEKPLGEKGLSGIQVVCGNYLSSSGISVTQ